MDKETDEQLPPVVQQQADEIRAAEAAGQPAQPLPPSPVVETQPVEAQPVPVEPTAEAAPEPAAKAPDVVPKALLDAEAQRRKTLEGRILAESKAQRAQTELLTQQLAEMRQSLEARREPEIPAHLRHLSAEEREAYASEEPPTEVRMMQGVVEAGQQKVAAELAMLKQQLESERQQRLRVEQQAHVDTRLTAVLKQVEQVHPGAMAMNDDPLFESFLDMADPNATALKQDGTPWTYRDTSFPLIESGNAKALAGLFAEFEQSGFYDRAVSPAVAAQVKPSPSAPAPPQRQTAPVFNIEDIDALEAAVRAGSATHPDGRPYTDEDLLALLDQAIPAALEGNVLRGGRRVPSMMV